MRARFPFPLIVWCEPSVFLALQEEAPDLYDHFIALVEFLYAGPRLHTIEGQVATPRALEDGRVTAGPPGSETSVAFYADLLTRHPEPSQERARALLGMAEALRGLRTADMTDRLRRALAAVEEALGILLPEEVARGQVLKGLILSDVPAANRAENRAKAIACYEAAVRGFRAAGLTEETDEIQRFLNSLRHADPHTSWLQSIAAKVKQLIHSLRQG